MHQSKYIFTGGAYREFRGYVFCNGAPVTIKDKATLAAIAKQPDFKEYHEEKKQETTQATVLAADPDACGKCGRIVRQGRYLHEKYCKG